MAIRAIRLNAPVSASLARQLRDVLELQSIAQGFVINQTGLSACKQL
jgi:hypothetical protein